MNKITANEFITLYFNQIKNRAKKISQEWHQELLSELYLHLIQINKKTNKSYWDSIDKSNEDKVINYCHKIMHNFFNLKRTNFNLKIRAWDPDRISNNVEINTINMVKYDNFDIEINADLISTKIMGTSQSLPNINKEEFKSKHMEFNQYKTLVKNSQNNQTGQQEYTYSEYLIDLAQNHTEKQMQDLIKIKLIKDKLPLSDRILYEYHYELKYSNLKISKITGLTKDQVKDMIVNFEQKIKDLYQQL